MNKQIALTNLGGFPLEQDTLKFMQDSYTGALGAFATLCGNKVILSGVVSAGGNVSSGWIVYNGELIPFIGGPLAATVVITTDIVQAPFEDGNLKDAYYTKTATCGLLGEFPFSDLVPLLSLQNIWKKDDVRMAYKDNAYIAANFDGAGFGTSPVEKGWRIFSYQVPGSAGKTFVNWNSADTDYNTVGNTGGSKTKTLQPNEQGSIDFGGTGDDGDGSTGSFASFRILRINGSTVSPPLNADSPDVNVKLKNDASPFDKRTPYFVMLHLIKL